MKKTSIAITVLVLFSVLLSACNLQSASPTQIGPDEINTIAAATVQALTTQMAPPPATNTPVPTEEPEPTATLVVPTLDLISVPTLSLATSTLIPLPTSIGSNECNKVFFISDENVPDGTVFKPGAKFTKSWKIRNDGTCTWNSAYYAVMFSNDPASPAITGLASKGIGTVAPGGIVVVSVELTAPEEDGTYTQYWKMQDADGKMFGIGGPNGAGWYVQIKVSKSGVVTPSTVTSAISYVPDTYSGTITSTGATITYNWQVRDTATSTWKNLTSPVVKTFNGNNVPVVDYTGGTAAACTLVSLTSGSTVTIRLNLNEYGFKSTDQTCP